MTHKHRFKFTGLLRIWKFKTVTLERSNSGKTAFSWTSSFSDRDTATWRDFRNSLKRLFMTSSSENMFNHFISNMHFFLHQFYTLTFFKTRRTRTHISVVKLEKTKETRDFFLWGILIINIKSVCLIETLSDTQVWFWTAENHQFIVS